MRYNSIYPTLERKDPRQQMLYLTKADAEFLEVYRQMTPEEKAEMRRLVQEAAARSDKAKAAGCKVKD